MNKNLSLYFEYIVLFFIVQVMSKGGLR